MKDFFKFIIKRVETQNTTNFNYILFSVPDKKRKLLYCKFQFDITLRLSWTEITRNLYTLAHTHRDNILKIDIKTWNYGKISYFFR